MANAKFKTNLGAFTVFLDMEKAPITAGNFIELSKKGYYNGLTFHRIIDGFMIQGGCPDGNGMGGPGYKIQDEFHPDLNNNKFTLSMANAGPNTGGSQFFINVQDNNFLDNKHAVFGNVTEGTDIVLEISRTQTGPGDKPSTPVVIESIEITD